MTTKPKAKTETTTEPVKHDNRVARLERQVAKLTEAIKAADPVLAAKLLDDEGAR